jgi:prolyl-tRNA editing enzyme YbaK/EbsC (Cys-tRNA(Pro) deacylase)
MPEIYRDKLALFIRSHAIAATLIEPAQETPTVALAAQALGCQPEQIVKSVLFVVRGGERDSQVLVIANGVTQIDSRKLADLLGVGRKRIRLAPADVVLAVTGYPAGGVPPFGFPDPLPTTIDQRVFDQAIVYGGGGDDHTMMRLTPAELLRITGGQIADVRKPADDG